jgi:zinc/manganese transport system substrate-binding protein
VNPAGRINETEKLTGLTAKLRTRSAKVALATVGLVALVANVGAGAASAGASTPKIVAVGAENEYANVIGQIGGKYVQVSSVLNNPNTDPHVFESSPRTAQQVSAAQLIVQNGVGYDTFMNTIESASPSPKRKVIVVQQLLGLPTDTPNPHLWYNPKTMPAVATALATALAKLQPDHGAYFRANATAFINSLKPWLADIAKVKATFPGAPVATTEPVGDYMLQAAGTHDLTPWSFSADVMNGVDTTPQDNAFQENLFEAHKVKVFVYNQQVTNSITQLLLSLAHQDGIPVVGVYETMPVPGYKYQTWMEAEVTALYNALAHGASTQKLSR